MMIAQRQQIGRLKRATNLPHNSGWREVGQGPSLNSALMASRADCRSILQTAHAPASIAYPRHPVRNCRSFKGRCGGCSLIRSV
jgi:hypothetical protein